MEIEQQPVEGVQEMNPVEEERFSEWASQRLALYQEMEQHVQASMAQTLELASDLTTRMEEEASQLLAHYRRQREEQEEHLATLRKEMADLRARMAREREEHIESLARARLETQQEIARQREAAQREIEQQRAEAEREREQLLLGAYSDREQILAETEQISAKLSQLQETLQSLVRSVAPSPTLFEGLTPPRFIPEAHNHERGPSNKESKQYEESSATVGPQEQGPDVAALFSESESDFNEIIADERRRTDYEEDDIVLSRLEAEEAVDMPFQEQAGGTTQLVIEEVQRFASAWDLIDRLEQHPAVVEVNLLLYEDTTLLLAVQHVAGAPLQNVLEAGFNDVLEFVKSENGVLHLRLLME